MNHGNISSQAVRWVLRNYWHQYRTNPTSTLIGFFLPAIGTIFIFFIPPLILSKIVDTFVKTGTFSIISVQKYIIFFGIFWLIGEICWRIGMHFLIRLQTRGINILAKESFSLLSARDYDFYTNHFVGSLTKKGTAFSQNFEKFTDTLAFNIFGNIFPLVFALIILGRYTFWLPLILLVCLSVVIAIAIPIIRRRAKLVNIRHTTSSGMVGRFSDSMTNILAIKSFAKEEYELKIYGEHVDNFTLASKKASDFNNLRFYSVLSPLYVATNIIGLLAAIFFSGKLGLSAGTIIVVFSYYSQISRIFWEINWTYRNIESAVSEAAEFSQMIITPPKIQNRKDAVALAITDASIVFKGLKFQYTNTGAESDDEPFLDDFNLEIKDKQRVGLVGASGSGKTTITKLLLRFIDLQSGSILIGGQDISNATQESLREVISYVPQDPLLFHRSLFENIAYSNSKATKEDVIEAAKIAHADEFIKKLPNGYDTMVGERGIKLSGGQRQRVVIARALLKKSPILILDEATSALDSESEKYIQEGLWELMKDKTALVIAHRLSTIKHLDRIIVLDQGKIVQDGTHDELIKQDGVYATLWNHQSGGFVE